MAVTYEMIEKAVKEVEQQMDKEHPNRLKCYATMSRENYDMILNKVLTSTGTTDKFSITFTPIEKVKTKPLRLPAKIMKRLSKQRIR